MKRFAYLPIMALLLISLPCYGSIIARNTFELYEGDSLSYMGWNTSDGGNSLILLYREEPDTFQTQRHGAQSLQIQDQDDTSYASAYKTFTNSASEYMVEFYFWIWSEKEASIDSFPLCILYYSGPFGLPTKTDIALVIDTVLTPPDEQLYSIHVEDASGFHSNQQYLYSSDIDTWHKIQIHRHSTVIFDAVDLYFDGDTVGTYTPMNMASKSDRILFGTGSSDSLSDGEIFYDDVIVTTPPIGKHPRLYFDSLCIADTLKDRMDDDSSKISFSYADIWDILESSADSFKTHDVIPYWANSCTLYYPYPQPAEHSDTTNEEQWLDLTTKIERRISFLTLYYILNDDTSYMNKAKKALVTLCNDWKQWTDPDFKIGRSYWSLLDTGRLLSGVSFAYDVLFDSLNNFERMTVQNSIISLGLVQTYCRALYDEGPHESTKRPWDWPNGNAVMLTGLGLGCLVQDSTQVDTFITTYLDKARSLLDTLADVQWVLDSAGGWSEGASYSAFGMTYLLAFMYADPILDSMILDDTSFIYNHAAWRTFCMLPVDSTFTHNIEHSAEINFCDYDYKAWRWTSPLYRLAAMFDDSCAQWYINQRPAQREPRDILYIFPFLWFKSTLDTLRPDSLHYFNQGIEWGIFRTGWNIDDCVFALKCDSLKAHTHYDRNSFIFGMGGRWFIEDWGYARSQGRPERFDDYHNVIIVNDTFSIGNSKAEITKFYGSSDYGYIMGDASACYEDLEKWTREAVFLKDCGHFVVKDWVKALPDSVDSLRWQVHSYIVPADSDSLSITTPLATSATISKESTHLRMEFHKPAEVSIDTTTPDTARTSFKRLYEVVDNGSDVDSFLFLTSYVAFSEGESCPEVSDISADSMYALFIDTEEDDNAILFSKRGNTVIYTQYEIDVPASYVVLNVLADMAGGTYKIEDEYPLGMSTATSYKAATSAGTLDFEITGSGTHRITVTKWSP